MTAREGRDKVVQLVQDSVKQLDVTGWWARGTAYAAPCESDPNNASQYSYDYWAPQGSDHRGDAQKIAAYWESLGMSVYVTGEDTDWPVVYGSGGPVFRADFDTSAAERSYRLGATAPCSPGDNVDFIREDDAARGRGELLPGDDVMVPESEIGEKFDEHLRIAEEADKARGK
ncbi:hypothetical protein FB468_3047 [Leucobacter komagatae]|uniref:Uncharacterized protein n=1 Tax=Leucobacter komagatae TaxID=55969 RepID=A0A542XXG4_9MICO|nr:hypothetical protein [Leucobacter komagatae]TQL40526.1 hypothetical protein FB468_3047 [Leucobacter komagatae]